ncbi:MAG: SDR family NAD(P)-dependent oxidoreductase, partial [Alphaproteobacteria bacterium]
MCHYNPDAMDSRGGRAATCPQKQNEGEAMDLGLEGQVALVTGAATGLGYTYAEALVREGVNVLLTDLDGDGAFSAAAELSKEGKGR